jgi:hypothetical protein
VFVQVLVSIIGLLAYGRILLVQMHALHEKMTVLVMNAETRVGAVEVRHGFVLKLLFAAAGFLAGYVVLQAIFDLDEWVREMLIGIGELGVVGGLMFVFWIGRARAERAERIERIEDLGLADIEDMPTVVMTDAVRPLLDSSELNTPVGTSG